MLIYIFIIKEGIKMAIEVRGKREFDAKEGPRSHVIAVRCNKGERAYIDKQAKKLKISRSAVVMQYFNEHRKTL